MKSLVPFNIIDVSCGSTDAQTLALSDDGNVWSWGDGDFGKLGRGGSEGCSAPTIIPKLSSKGVCKVLCGAQFSIALTSQGEVWTWYISYLFIFFFYLSVFNICFAQSSCY